MNHIECLLRGKPSVNVFMVVREDKNKVEPTTEDKVESVTKDKVESVTIHIMMFGNGYDDSLDMEIEGSICGTTISSRSAAIIKDDTISKHLGSNNLLLEITGNIEGEDSATILRPVKITAIMTEITPETKEFGAMEVSKCQIIISGNLRHDNTASTYDVEDGIIMSPGILDVTQSRVTASEATPGSENSTLPVANLDSAKSTEKRQESQAQYLILLKYIIEQESVNIGDQDDICYNAVLAFLSMCGVLSVYKKNIILITQKIH